MKFLIKAAFVALTMVSLNAKADIITNLSSVGVPFSINYGQSFSAASSGTTFFDDYIFTIDAGSTNSVTSSIDLGNFLGISNMRARLYTGSNHYTSAVPLTEASLLENWGTTANLGSGVSLTTVVLNPIALTAGTYTLQIKGTVTGTSGGSYAGLLNVAPVPEPESYAMLLSGLALFGFATRKREKST
ncbi:MAG: PEP-CTERM sorting domain-containing protein [Methylophilaceae bacterium]|nr:PEP-CTERM sorting domain-containing protein [Methylophilaceae bacterium]